jgi:hypothetical protein
MSRPFRQGHVTRTRFSARLSATSSKTDRPTCAASPFYLSALIWRDPWRPSRRWRPLRRWSGPTRCLRRASCPHRSNAAPRRWRRSAARSARSCAARPAPSRRRPAPTADPEFRRWIAGFRQRALGRGSRRHVRPRLRRRAAAGRIVERDRNQAEFSRTLWDYLDSAVSDTRISNGRAAVAEHRETLQRIERQYRVEAEVVAAIWGLESAYGASADRPTSSRPWRRWPMTGAAATSSRRS